MGIELLVSKSEEIIESLSTDEKASKEATKNYKILIKELREKYRYFSPVYHKDKPELTYIC